MLKACTAKGPRWPGITSSPFEGSKEAGGSCNDPWHKAGCRACRRRPGSPKDRGLRTDNVGASWTKDPAQLRIPGSQATRHPRYSPPWGFCSHRGETGNNRNDPEKERKGGTLVPLQAASEKQKDINI